jgi:thiosulfate/3-mercaptopyruvate sulfurtransferase
MTLPPPRSRFLVLAALATLLATAAPSECGDVPATERWARDPLRIAEWTIVSPRWTARHRDALVLLDARDATSYAGGHLPGAFHVPVSATRAARDGRTDLRAAPELRRVFGAAGVGGESEVVVYADERVLDATHVFLALATLGHRRIALLEGGVRAWVAEGRTVSRSVPRAGTASYPERPGNGLVVGADDVAAATEAGLAVLLDSRPADAFSGSPGRAGTGHAAGALNRPCSEDVVVGSKAVLFRSRAALVEGYRRAGVPDRGGSFASCGTGLHASQTWFVLAVLLGREGVRWYDGSFEDWVLRGLPVETGPAPAATAPMSR